MVEGADSLSGEENERGICKCQLGPVCGGVPRGRLRHLDCFLWVFGAVKLQEKKQIFPHSGSPTSP